MGVDLRLVQTGQIWHFDSGPIRIGRDPQAGIPLPAADFPGVSREHATLHWEAGQLRVQDLRSGNGTFLNGVRVSVAALKDGDVIRLGEQGPELAVALIVAAPAGADTQPATQQATQPIGRAAGAFTMPAATPPSFEPAAHATMVSVTPAAAPKPARASGFGSAPAAVAAPPSAPAADPAAMAALETALGNLKLLVALILAAVIVLLGIILYQAQQINETRGAVAQLRVEAASAAGQLMPQLDQRLNGFEGRLDGVDGKMQAAEDQFFARLNRELPQILDRYVNQKVKEMGVKPPIP